MAPPIRLLPKTRPAPQPTTAALVEQAQARGGTGELQWETLAPKMGRRCPEPALTLLPIKAKCSGLRLNVAALRGIAADRVRVRVDIARLPSGRAIRAAVVVDPAGRYLLHKGHLGGSALVEELARSGIEPGRYRARCTPGRVEIVAADRLP